MCAKTGANMSTDERSRLVGRTSTGDGLSCVDISTFRTSVFSVKEWPDPENKVRVRSRSLEMAPIDRLHTSLNT